MSNKAIQSTIPIHPNSGEFPGEDIASQTHQSLGNVKAGHVEIERMAVKG